MTIDWVLLIEFLIKAIISSFVLLTGFAYMTYTERKVAAALQTRIGPNRAGPFGLLQPAADGLKIIFKEEFVPAGADKLMFHLAPVITVIPALIILAVVPWGPPVPVPWRTDSLMPLGFADLNVGMLYILSVASIAVYGIVLAGWSSDNKYAMMGGIRASAQMVSYELALGLSVVGPLMLAGSMSMGDIVNAQSRLWFVLLQPVGALLFYIAALAEVNRAPFDMPEAEQELTAGYHTEYSGIKFTLFFMAEYIKMIGVSAIFVTLFLGGWRGPLLSDEILKATPWLGWLGILYFWLKIGGSLVFMIWLRSTHPRLRYDRLMTFGWKVLIPIALANVLVTAAAQISRPLMWGVIAVLAVIVGIIIIANWRRSQTRPAGVRRVRA
jgi:NADH-quinone oxidoreductase subunit H